MLIGAYRDTWHIVPKPAIKLESITASVPMNQSEIKDARFGADGTGNKATASATVTLNP